MKWRVEEECRWMQMIERSKDQNFGGAFLASRAKWEEGIGGDI